MAHWFRLPKRVDKRSKLGVHSSCGPVETWHPLPRWFRSVAATQQSTVLLETAKFDAENFRSFLFMEPLAELTAWAEDETSGVFAAIDQHLEQGSFVAGFVSYECGAALHGITPLHADDAQKLPLVRMGVFQHPAVFDHRTGTITGSQLRQVAANEREAAEIHRAELQIDRLDYEYIIHTIQDYLAAGHSYQVNFTDRVSGDFTGTPLGLYEQVLSQQPVSYAAFLNVLGQQILSFSPELFYRVQQGRISVRPMKGTWPRGRNVTEDEHAARSLLNDEKNRAEHVTIVDLLRNDLGRVCELGSVAIDALMRVERYSTLHQMTSDISGTLQPHLTASEIFQALFPSGSITGAPKRRTMEIIQETERSARGVYTGAIGYFHPHGEACFNVAIRTLLVENNSFTLGVGGGITVDSTAQEEYRECELKASFLTNRRTEFYLFETMRGLEQTIPQLEAHLRRLHESALYFGVRYDEAGMRHDLAACLDDTNATETRVRLLLQQNGTWSIETTPLVAIPWSGRVLLWPEPVQSSDAFLQHKTSNRKLYRRALLQAQQGGCDEVIFQNEDGLMTEGAISNLFARVRGTIVTPDVSCGLLPGVERANILASRLDVQIGFISQADLAEAGEVFLCNALRGSRSVTAIVDVRGRHLWQYSGPCSRPIEMSL